MASQHCTTCMAALPLGEVGSITKCQYCGTEARVLAPESPRAPEAVPPPPAAPIPAAVHAALVMRSVEEVREEIRDREERAKSARVPVIIAIFVVATLATGFLFVLTRSGSTESVSGPAAVAPPLATPVAPPPAETTSPGLSRADLARFDSEEWTKLDASGMPGSMANLDPIAATPWALDLARGWSPDALLRILYVEGVSPDGRMDVAQPSVPGGTSYDVDWRFYSPARRRAASSMAQVSETTVHTDFRIEISNGEAKIFAFTPRSDPEPAEFLPACPLGQMLDAFRANGMPMRPHYDLMLHEVQIRRRKRWVWEENMYLELPTGISGDAACAPVRIPE